MIRDRVIYAPIALADGTPTDAEPIPFEEVPE